MDRRNDNATWAPERVAQLERLLADPRRLTTQQIANELGGVSRNAVIGKAGRLGLQLPNRGLHTPWRSRAPKDGLLQELLPAPDAPADPPSSARRRSRAKPKHIAFLDLEPRHCRWPYGRRLPFTFCGCDRITRSAYCAVHTGESRREQAEPTNVAPGRGQQTTVTAAVASRSDEHARRSQRAA